MNRHIRTIIRETDDRYYDPWGTAIAHGFAIAEVLSAPEIGGEIPPEISYQHGAYAPPSLSDLAVYDDSGEYWLESQYAQALLNGEISADDLTHALRVLGRHLDLCKAHGRDY